MDVVISGWGALAALVVAITLILRKVPPAYGMMLGALVGGLVGGAELVQTVTLMITGAQGLVTAILRILAAGVLAGILIESNAANKIADSIINALGETRALLALALATLCLTAVGVFIDVAVITVAPIALSIAQRADISRMSVLLAMIGGGKAGNVMSPNPNAIAASDAFGIPLTSVMSGGIVPGLMGLIVAYWLAKYLAKKGSSVLGTELEINQHMAMPSLLASLAGPILAIFLLALRPLFGITIDPMIALPLGGIFGAILMGRWMHITEYSTKGLNRMSGVVIMLLGTGTLAGIISASELKTILGSVLQAMELPSWALAPFSGMLMSAATASTTAGTAVASQVFGQTLLGLGVGAVAAAVMTHTGATVLDHLPHGSFFHATGGSVNMAMKERLKVMPYETLVGLSITLVATLMYGILGF